MIFRHYRTEKYGSITVCGEVIKDKAFAMGVAFCSPKEKHFSKKIGRQIATERMEGLLNRTGTTFGRGWCLIAKQDASKIGMHIARVLPEVIGPRWYSKFLGEIRKIRMAKKKAEMQS